MGLQTSTAAIFGVALQSALGTPNTTDNAYKYFATTNLGYGPNQQVTPLPAESGKTIVTRGAYKAQLRASGPIGLLPRLENRFDYLLLSAMGADSLLTGADTTYTGGRLMYKTPPAATVAATFDATAHTIAAGSGLDVFSTGDYITIIGSLLNDGLYKVSTATGTLITVADAFKDVVDEGPTTGVVIKAYEKAYQYTNIHQFRFHSTEAYLPYFTTRRKLPHLTGSSALGETIADNHVATAEFTLPNTGLFSTTMEFAGRGTTFVPNPDSDFNLGTDGTFDADADYALAVDPASMAELNGVALKCTGITASLDNGLLPPDQGMIVGALFPVDHPVMSRTINIRATVFVEDYDLYRRMFAGAADGTEISSKVFQGNFRFRAFSPGTFLDTAVSPVAQNMAIEFINGNTGTEKNVSWTIQNAITLQPRQIVMMTLQGIVQFNPTGSPLSIRVQNGHGAVT